MAKLNPNFWHGKRVFLTGHTGFKGSWMSLWLQSMGADVRGLALNPPTHPALFTRAQVTQGMHSEIGDIRDYNTVLKAMVAAKPDIVIHMAAQPLVRQSYIDPVQTYATNVMGTVHLLEAVRKTNSVRAIVNVTTDKCYENKEWMWGYREDEPMGGYDPYSSSKGCSELVSMAYRQSFFNADVYEKHGVALATARAGNVIGGGDWAADRLVPDVLRAVEQGQVVQIRSPYAIRPWQHVLEPLSGYLQLAQALYEGGPRFAEAFNFGPADDDAKSVQWIVQALSQLWGGGATWALDEGAHPHEANFLKLDCSKAKAVLGWEPHWRLPEALAQIVKWHKAHISGENMRDVCLQQILDYSQKLTEIK
jgi:CDP-glucose 4,6-dehydratase